MTQIFPLWILRRASIQCLRSTTLLICVSLCVCVCVCVFHHTINAIECRILKGLQSAVLSLGVPEWPKGAKFTPWGRLVENVSLKKQKC